jgi:hypothetical protein
MYINFRNFFRLDPPLNQESQETTPPNTVAATPQDSPYSPGYEQGYQPVLAQLLPATTNPGILY